MEQQRLQKGSTDVVETFKSTPIRALNPKDLIISASSLSPGLSTEDFQGAATEHRIEIRNSGDVSYYGIQFLLVYTDATGAELGSRFHQAMERIPPGLTVISFQVPSSSIPSGAVRLSATTVYADIETEE